jgi:FAD/FMN-containing dehydrogenase
MISRRALIQGAATTAVLAGTSVAGAATAPWAAASATPNWSQLAGRLVGTLVLPSNSAYPTDKQIAWGAYNSINPAAIAYCANAGDVAQCLLFAQANGIPATARSGGHSFLGSSLTTGLVIDVSALNRVSLSGTQVTVGAGALQVDIVRALAGTGYAVPTAFYPAVGSGGYIQGGGIGFATRMMGVACDALLSAQVVLANGSVVDASPVCNPDLYWALRGGGGGNFGIVTSYVLRATPVSSMTNFTLNWDWSHAADVLAGWQEWAFAAPTQLSSGPTIAMLDTSPGAVPSISVSGAWMGDPAALPALLGAFVAEVGQSPTSQNSTSYDYATGMLTWYGCASLTDSQCHRTGTSSDGELNQFSWTLDRSRYFSAALPSAGIDAMLNAVTADLTAGQLRFMRAIVLGGAANELSRTATAYVHRDSQFIVSWDVGLPSNTPAAADQAAAGQWADNAFDAVDPYSNGESYVNYLDPHLTDYAQAYYRENLPRLIAVKAEYDPGNFFSSAQSIQ